MGREESRCSVICGRGFCVYIFYEVSENTTVPRYVGKGRETRIGCHVKNAKLLNRARLSKSIKFDQWLACSLRTGRQWKCSLVMQGQTERAVNEWERALIAKLGRRDQGKGPLLNMTDGGEGTVGLRASDSFREKRRIYMSGRKLSVAHCAAVSASLTGKKHSRERIENMKKSLTGRTLSPSHVVAITAAVKGERNPFYGKHHTEETKALIGIKNSGKLKGVRKPPRSKEHCLHISLGKRKAFMERIEFEPC